MMLDRTSPAEVTLRLVVGWFIQSFEAVSLVGLFAKTRGSELVLQIDPIIVGLYHDLLAVAVVIGAALCWRFRDSRRYVAWIVVVLIVASVADNLATGLSQQDAKLPAKRLEVLKSSDSYLRIVASREAAQDDLEVLMQRTLAIPPTFTTQLRENEAAKALARTAISKLDNELSTMEKEASAGSDSQNADTKSGGVLLGGNWNIWFSVLMTSALEALALSLTNIWKGQKTISGLGWFQRLCMQYFRRVPKDLRGDHLAYLQSAVSLGKDGVLAGYRAVAKAMNIKETKARRLMEECCRHRYIRDRQLRVLLPSTPSNAIQ